MGITGVTNGCFDPIHVGHIYFLTACKEKVDKLIVFLNSDQSIRELKKKNKPYQLIHERKFVLQSLKSVDEVIVFEDEKHLEILMLKYRPDILFKGMDYQGKHLTGQKYAKKIELIPLYSDWSSTNLINHLLSLGDYK
jgi:D-beta-D-heptose 7-phosphate kinase/D-beta-D-heptose 1-phosphate adenosyltransferase